MSDILKITLDTNCVINLLDFYSETATSVDYITELIRFSHLKKIDIAITTRVENDVENDGDEKRRNKMLERIGQFPIIGTMGRFGVTKFGGGDIYVSNEEVKLREELKNIIFPGLLPSDKRNNNKVNDIDHLVGHIINKRDIFVTEDKEILRKRDTLKISPGIVVISPQECVEYVEEIEEKQSKKILENPSANPGYHSPAFAGGVSFDYSNNNGTYVIGEGYFLFETKWSKASDICIYAYNDATSIEGVALAKEIENINQIKGVETLDFSSRCRPVKEGQILILKNVNNIYAAIKVIDIKDESRNDSKDELTFEYLILTDGSSDFSSDSQTLI